MNTYRFVSKVTLIDGAEMNCTISPNAINNGNEVIIRAEDYKQALAKFAEICANYGIYVAQESIENRRPIYGINGDGYSRQIGFSIMGCMLIRASARDRLFVDIQTEISIVLPFEFTEE